MTASPPTTAVLGEIVPAGVVAADAFGSDAEVLASNRRGQPAAELAAFAGRAPARRRASAAGRVCARRALAGLGAPSEPVLPGPAGEPLWPSGVVGSISHCSGYRAAAVAWRGQWRAIGIDAEPDGPLRPDLVATFAHPAELDRIRLLGRRGRHQPHWERLLFCAKEAAFKLVFPTVGQIVEFDELLIDFDSSSRELTATLVDASTGTTCRAGQGQWAVRHAMVVVALAEPAAGDHQVAP